VPNEGQLLMTIFKLDQAEEEILTHQISDEALEMAGSGTAALHVFLLHCFRSLSRALKP